MDLILPDQPNRRIRTRMYGGVGGALSDGRPYPDVCRVRHVFLRVSIYHIIDILQVPDPAGRRSRAFCGDGGEGCSGMATVWR